MSYRDEIDYQPTRRDDSKVTSAPEQKPPQRTDNSSQHLKGLKTGMELWKALEVETRERIKGVVYQDLSGLEKQTVCNIIRRLRMFKDYSSPLLKFLVERQAQAIYPS